MTFERSYEKIVAGVSWKYEKKNLHLDIVDLPSGVVDLFARTVDYVLQSHFDLRGVKLPGDFGIADLTELHFPTEQVEKGRSVNGQLTGELSRRFQLVDFVGYVEIHRALIAAGSILLAAAAATLRFV